jgi:hypothetical protein
MTLASYSYVPSGSKVAAYFEVGDLILFGKYKNKKGRIVGFEMDEKGQPVVEIEPVPKGQKQNKKLTLFKIRKAPSEGKTASQVALRYLNPRKSNMLTTAQKVATRVRVASRYKVAYAEREAKLALKAYEQLSKTASYLKEKYAEFERLPKQSPKRAEWAETLGKYLEFSLQFAEVLYSGLELFVKSYQPNTSEQVTEFDTFTKQWNGWKRDIEAFVASAQKYLAKKDPDGYFWPINLLDPLLNVASPLAHGAFQLITPTLAEPSVEEGSPIADALRAYATGKVVGLARQFVKDLGRDKKTVALFVLELMEDVNMSKLHRALKTTFRVMGDSPEAFEAATKAGKLLKWRPDHAVGLAYAALKAVGSLERAEQLLAAAAEDRWFKWKFKGEDSKTSV